MSFTPPDPPPQFEGHLADYLESDRPHLGRFGPPLSPIQKLARSDCSLKAIQDALEKGVVLDCHWQKLDMIDPEPTGGCVLPRYILSHEQSWANYNTPFHKAVVNHHFDGATFLLAHGISVDVRNALRQTALHEAVEPGERPDLGASILNELARAVFGGCRAELYDPTLRQGGRHGLLRLCFGDLDGRHGR